MKYLELFENKKDFSQFDFDKIINDLLFYVSQSTPDLLKMVFLLGGNIKDDNDNVFFFMYKATNFYLKVKILKTLVNDGGIDINRKESYNGISKSSTILINLSRNIDRKEKVNLPPKIYELIKEVIDLGGDMTIKDNFGKCGYDYLNDGNVERLNELIPDFKDKYIRYKKIKKYNI